MALVFTYVYHHGTLMEFHMQVCTRSPTDGVSLVTDTAKQPDIVKVLAVYSNAETNVRSVGLLPPSRMPCSDLA